MDLDIFQNLEEDENLNNDTNNFVEELEDFINSETMNNDNEEEKEEETEQSINEEYRKEGHLYLVTEDRNNKIYLWDYTEQAETEFVETDLPEEVLVFAKEGAMLQYINGEYILYSPDGYDIIFNI